MTNIKTIYIRRKENILNDGVKNNNSIGILQNRQIPNNKASKLTNDLMIAKTIEPSEDFVASKYTENGAS